MISYQIHPPARVEHAVLHVSFLQQGVLQQRCMATAPFVYQDVMEMGPSTTEYRKLPGDYVQTSIVNGKTILQVRLSQ